MTESTQQFGKYRILEELGVGGFASVYKAVDTTLDRQVALKILHPQLLTDRRFVQNFRQEARTLAALRHPQIITIYEVGEVEGRLFIAMDLAHGVSLAQSIAKRGRIPWDEMLAVLKPVCEALDYAHGQKVVHRDLKPANLLLDMQRGALLTDFGFARLMAENSASMTMSGGIIGTPGYIAPEVWENNAADTPVDIYALGCIVYEMLTGDVLFKGQTPLQAVYAHSRGPQFPSMWPDDVPPGITTVLAKALARDPADRYASAGALWQALYQLNSQVQTASEPAKPIEATSHANDAKPIEVVQQEAQPAALAQEDTQLTEAAQEEPQRVATAQQDTQPTQATSHTAAPRAEDAQRITTTQEEPKRVELTQTAESSAPPGTLSAAELVLILLAIMIDIGGVQLSKALQLPLWIDSIGTILAGALFGPWIGAITGLLAHSLWGLLGFDQYALSFAPNAAVCGLLAGFAGRQRLFQRASPRWLSAAIGGVFLFALTLFVFMFINSYSSVPRPNLPVAADLVSQNGPVFLAALALGLVIGFFVLRNAGYAGVAGLITGVATTIITAPIAAYVFGGDTAIIARALFVGDRTVVEPFDKLLSFMIVYLIIQLLPQRLLQRFPNTRAVADIGIGR
jgi:serine/threonine protein kinase